jgi:CubicO group peptidase (beta-lactamase class C family)
LPVGRARANVLASRNRRNPRAVITRSVRLLALTVGSQLSLPVPQAQACLAQGPPSDSTIQAIIHELIGSGGDFGIAVCLLNADGSRHVLADGSAGRGALPLDGNSVLDIGSITKVFTRVLLADMAQRGEVRLDDPLAKYLPRNVRCHAVMSGRSHSSIWPHAQRRKR